MGFINPSLTESQNIFCHSTTTVRDRPHAAAPMDSLSPGGSNEPSTPTRDSRGPRQWGANLFGAAASAWHAIRGMPYGDDDHETPGCPDDDDNDSIAGDAEYVNNLALGMCVQWPYVDVLRPFSYKWLFAFDCRTCEDDVRRLTDAQILETLSD